MTHWTHGHSIATGFALGLVLDRETLVVLVIGVALGAGLVLASRYFRRVVSFAHEQGSRLSSARAEAHAAKAELDLAEAERKRAAAAEHLARAERYVRTAKEQEKEIDHAYRQGAADDEHHRELWLEGRGAA